MTTEPLTLYVDKAWTSPWALTAYVALVEKELEFDVREVGLRRGVKTFGARTGEVPALVHGDYWLAESMAIAEYLAEAFPYPTAAKTMLFPPDLRDRGVCREVMMWLRSSLHSLRRERPASTLFGLQSTRSQRARPLSMGAEEDAARLIATASLWVADGRTTLFSEWCIADPDLALALKRLSDHGFVIPERLAVYADANWKRPSVLRFLQHHR